MEVLGFLREYGYELTFAAVFLEMIGLPVPAVPVLVSMGALSRSGDFSLGGVLLTALAASMTSDLIWYNLGRYYGRSVLRLICRISLEPDSCVRRTEDAFVRRGIWSLLFAKFVPGMNAASVPLAGMIGIPIARFLVLDIAGLVLWAGGYSALGFVFSNDIERLIDFFPQFGHSVGLLIVSILGAYVGYKLLQRHRFHKSLEGTRISAAELKARMDSGSGILVFDLRNPLETSTERIRIPGAFHVLPATLGLVDNDVPRDRDIVLYCTCPNEATSARVAKQLQQMGILRVRPLSGGLDAWRAEGFPIESC